MIILKHLDSELILISSNNSLLLYNSSNDSTKDITLPKGFENSKSSMPIRKILTSRCREYFALLSGKQVIIYNKDLLVLKEITLKRAANAILLFNGYDLLVADKTGDVYMFANKQNEENGTKNIIKYNVENETKNASKCNPQNDENGIFLFGHISMLLDICLSEDEKYILSCDRDEKIRVSHYPNTYHIENYCLGHKEFVTKLILLEAPYFLSSGGDGQIILWNYLNGTLLHQIDTNEFVKDKTVVENFIDVMGENKSEVECLPIIDIQIQKGEKFYFVVAQLHKLHSILVFSLYIESTNIESKFMYEIPFNSEIQTFSLNKELFVATLNEITAFNLSEDGFNKIEKKFFETYKISNELEDDFYIITMYKRKYDNVEEYLERKRQRIELKPVN